VGKSGAALSCPCASFFLLSDDEKLLAASTTPIWKPQVENCTLPAWAS